jgi:hypothetical protein
MEVDCLILECGLYKDAAYEFPEREKAWMPEWLTKHKAFEAVKGSNVFKVFSKFGLKDFRKNIDDPAVVEDFKDFLIKQLNRVIFAKTTESAESNQLEQVAYRLIQALEKPDVWGSGKHRLTVPVASEDKKFRIDAGTSVIKAYNTVRAKAAKRGIEMPDIE